MEKEQVEAIILDEEYLGLEDLRYNAQKGYLFSKNDLQEFKELKDELIDEGYEHIKKIPLKSFNSKHIFYVTGNYLLDSQIEYLKTMVQDYQLNKQVFLKRHFDQLLESRIFSEIEGTLNIENVPTTHKRIKEACHNGNLTDKNDVIIRNMYNAINFIIMEKPEFNKENLYKLYNILSKDCLDEEDELKGGYYRNDAVSVGGYDGAPCEKIEELMDSLFAFVNDESNSKAFDDLMPHICHYYILYVHPYFDYNGRTARMVSFWISRIKSVRAAPIFISEAINENKKAYYDALSDTRDMNNDLTYFLGYIFNTSVKFSLVYKNVEEIEKLLQKNGNFLNQSEKIYLKKILIHNPDRYFNSKLFITYLNNNMSKQGAAKILNQLTEYGLLKSSINKKGEKIYIVDSKVITYTNN